jgi:flagellar biosynthesis/type III secretory pathway ATPase
MAATPEAKVKAKIKALLQKHSIYYAMPIGTMYGNSGVPDFLCCVNGRFLGIEAKAGKGKPTALQFKNMRDIEASGGVTAVINEHGLESLEALLGMMERAHIND